jgi:hypothetical protein
MNETLVTAKQFGIEPKKETEIMGNLPQILNERNVFEFEYNCLIKKNPIEPKTVKEARDLRLKIRDNRTKGILVWHKNSKEFFLRGGQFCDAIKNKETEVNLSMENRLDEIENYAKELEIKRLQEMQDSRVLVISEFLENASEINFSLMDQDVWEAYLSAKKNAFNLREQEKREVIERQIAKDKAEQAAREAQRLENEKLRAEAVAKDKEIQKEREAQKAILEAQRAEAVKLQAELDKKKALEIQVENEKKEAELKAKKEAEKKAKEPLKKQLLNWVVCFSLPDTNIKNEKSILIQQKFEAFKKWAKSEIETI